MLHLIAVSYLKIYVLSNVTQYPLNDPLPELYTTGTVEASCSNFSMKPPRESILRSVNYSEDVLASFDAILGNYGTFY